MLTTTIEDTRETRLQEPITLSTNTTASTQKQVVTTLTDLGAFQVLSQVQNLDNFTKALLADYRRYKSWWTNKRVWAHVKAMEAMKSPLPAHLVANAQVISVPAIEPLPVVTEPPLPRKERVANALEALIGAAPIVAPSPVVVAPAPPRPIPAVPFGHPIVEMAKTAAPWVKRVKFRLLTPSGLPVVLKAPGTESSYHGFVFVNDGGTWGNQTYYGKFDDSGFFHATRACTTEILDLLIAFAETPATVAHEYGKTTKSCCFCTKILRDTKSISAGYGKDCADRYGLPWGA